PIEERLRHGRAFEQLEIFLTRAAAGWTADALAFVHAQARRGDFGKRFAEQRTEPARLQRCEAGRIERNVAVLEKERRRVPDEPVRFPNCDRGELLRKALRVGGGGEGFARENGRTGVVPVRLVVLGTEPRDD